LPVKEFTGAAAMPLYKEIVMKAVFGARGSTQRREDAKAQRKEEKEVNKSTADLEKASQLDPLVDQRR
jgi:hypothetical protein